MLFQSKPPKTNKNSDIAKGVVKNTKTNMTNTIKIYSGKANDVKKNIKKDIEEIKDVDLKKMPKNFYIYLILTVVCLIGIWILVDVVFKEVLW